MSTKELIQREIENTREEDLGGLYYVIRSYKLTKGKPTAEKPGALAKLKRIRIEASPDFAANLNSYVSGVRRRSII